MTNTKLHYSCLIGLLLVSGCVSDQYRPSDLADELGYTSQVSMAYQADEQWWKLYQNTELDRLVTKALTNNPDYLKAAIKINKELYNLGLADSDLFPTLSSNLGVSTKSAIKRTGDYSSNFSGEFGINYEVDLYGKIRDKRLAQKFELQATVMDRQSARLSLINSVVDLYYNLEYLQNSINLTRKNIDAYENIQKIMAQKYETGKTDSLEYLESKQSVLTEKNRLLQLETQFRELETSLKNIIGVRPDENFFVQYGDIINQVTPKVNLNVPMSVLGARPDLLASQYRLEKAFKNLQASEKQWYPQVSLSGFVQSSSDKARTMFDFPFLAGSIGLDLPFLDWNRVKNNVKLSEADYQIVAIDFKDTLTQALNELAYYNFAYEKSLQNYDNIAENYQNAVKITAYYKQRYDNGKTEFRDYLEAINRENSLRKDLISQKYMIIKYENYIYKSMGGKY